MMIKISTERQMHIIANFAAILFLAAVTFIVHKSALSGFWRYDDGMQLSFAVKYSPWQYFFIPEITSLQSGHQFVTPWNAFFYDINLWLFGFSPKGFYAHQLIVLWLSGVATFFLLRLWVSTGWALFGATLFLSNAATVYVAQELMDGHYAAGLLFSILALYGYVRAVREQNWRPALIGAFFYLLAVLCKEIYVPLIGILLFLPEGELRTRLRFAQTYGLLALGYIPWRYIVLNGSLGGHDPGFITNLSLAETWQIIRIFFRMPEILLGGESAAYALLLTISFAYFYNKRNKLPVFIVGYFLAAAPLAPVWKSLVGIGRYHFFFWWSSSIYFAILLSTWAKPKPIRYLLAVLLLVLSLNTSYREMYSYNGSKAVRDCHDAASKFILNSNSEQVLYDTRNVWYPVSNLVGYLVKVEKELSPSSPPRALVTQDLDTLDSFLLSKKTVWSYNERCRCMENISSRVPLLVLDYRKKQIERPLFLNLKYDQNTLSWQFGPYGVGIYEIVTDFSSFLPDSSKGTLVIPMPSKGTLVIPMPSKGTDRRDILHYLDFYLRYTSPSGWVTRSPSLHFEPVSGRVLTWTR
jgi:hypothetical protein